MSSVDHLLDGPLSNKLSHAVVDPAASKYYLGNVTYLFRFMSKIVRINPYNIEDALHSNIEDALT